MARVMTPSRFLFLLVGFIALAFMMRLGGVIMGVSALSQNAYAEDKMADKPTENQGIIFQDDSVKDKMTADEMSAETDEMAVDVPNVDTSVWQDAGDTDLQNAALQMEMLQELADKKKSLEQREKQLMMREALLKASAKEIDQKYEELSTIKREIEGLLIQQSDEEKARILSLVKVYEGMKAKDAARIFDTLDIDVLVAVMSEMSERRISPILAAMNPERARTVTIILAEQKTLPELPHNQF